MKNLSFFLSICFSVFILIGCSDDPVQTINQSDSEASFQKAPDFSKANHEGTGEFSGPIFDLALLPNNDLLVADIGFGISNKYGADLYSLPGVSNISPVGTGTMWAITWPSGPPTTDAGQAIYRVGKGRTEMVANLFAFEQENNPDGGHIESNPYSVYAENSSFAVVADAAANDLLRVDNKGNIEVMAIFPNEMVSTENVKSLIGCPNEDDICSLPPMIPAEPVPTSVVKGPDGYFYVGELKGFPAPVGESNIWKISADANGAMCGSSQDCMKAFDGGFTSIIDLEFGSDGTLYVAELDAQSWFAVEFLGTGAGGTIKACNTETMQCVTIASGIPLLTAISFDKDGKLWAIQNGLIPDLAEVIEIGL